MAAGALFRRGVILHSGEALERLPNADTVVFDKTGTLTQPRPILANAADIAPPISRSPAAWRWRAGIRSRRRSPRRPARQEPMAAQEFPGEGVSAGS